MILEFGICALDIVSMSLNLNKINDLSVTRTQLSKV